MPLPYSLPFALDEELSMPMTSSAARRPPLPDVPFGMSVMPRVEHATTVTGMVSITETFDHLDNWVTLAKTPAVASGRLGGEGVVRHRDQMMTDDHLVTGVIGTWDVGKTRIACCADASFTRWYGIEIETGLVNNKLHIIKGVGPTALLDGGIFSSVDKLATVNQAYIVGDEVSVRWDEERSMIRAYLNGVEKTRLPVPRWEIPHGVGFRHWGAAQGVDIILGVLNYGVRFTSVTAHDYTPPTLPDYIDTFDNIASLANWTELDDGVAIHKHLFAPNSFGPDNVFFTDAAVLWNAQMATDSVKVLIRPARYGAGKLTVAVCSNAAMTNWMGVQLETGVLLNRVHAVRGTGPSDYVYVGESDWEFTSTGELLSVVYNEEENTLGLYRAHNLSSPIIEWVDSSNLVSHGAGNRYTGLLWETALLSPGVEPTRWEAYNRSTTEGS